MLWDRVGLSVVGWAGARGGTRHSYGYGHKPISIITNHKSPDYHVISSLGDFSLRPKMDSQYLATT